MYKIILENTVTHQQHQFQCEDINNGEKLYYKFNIDTLGLDDGEYKMTLLNNRGKVEAEDILKIGDFNPSTLQYKSGDNTYIAIDLDAKLGAKNAVISSVESAVYPDDGYDGMTSVTINAQGVYDSGYDVGNLEGYNSGYTNGKGDGLTEGYSNGYNEGKDDGIVAGKDIQKSLLTTISITENGTYTREDGYNEITVDVPDVNGSYDEGYEDGVAEGTANAGAIIAETARTLNITENGTYTSQYTKLEDINLPDYAPSGEYADGTPFYGYIDTYQTTFKTNIPYTLNTRLEFWYIDTYSSYGENFDNPLVSDIVKGGAYNVFGMSYSRGNYCFKIGDAEILVPKNSLSTEEFNHIIMSVTDGLIINNKKIGNFENPTIKASEEIRINGWSGNYSSKVGMVKIDDVLIIPTPDGMLNTTTNELLPTSKGYGATFTYIEDYKVPTIDGNLIRTVNVNIVPKINMQLTGLKLAYSNITEVPDWVDWEGITDMSFMFYNCKKINTLPEINTSNVTNMSNIFENCTNLIDGNELLKWDFGNVKTLEKAFNYTQLDKIPSIDTKNVTNFSYAFANFAKYLKEVEPINTSNATTFNNMFYDFSTESVLEKLPEFDCTKVTTINNMFAYSGYQNKLPKLTDCGGWKNLKAKWNDGYGLNHCPNLTYQSCINILNGLYDFTGNGETPTSSQGKLKVHSNFLTLVGDEISIGTNKGWTITT